MRSRARPTGSERMADTVELSGIEPARAEANAGAQGKERLLVLAPQPFYQDRGTPIALRQVLLALSELGWGADVLTFPGGRDPEVPGVRLIQVPNPLGIRDVPIGFSTRKLALDVSMIGALRRQLATNPGRYMGIHAVEEAAFPAVAAGRRRGLPVLYDMQSSLPEQLAKFALARPLPIQHVMRSFERWVLKRADLVVCSAGLAERVREVVPEVRIREWHFPSANPPIPSERTARLREDLRIPAGAPVVAYGGTFEWYQGLDLLVAAMPAIRELVPNVIFLLVGADDRLGLEVIREGGRLGVSGAMWLVSRQPRHVVRDYLALADVLVSPRAHGENLPLKIFDYAASGRPIVATDTAVHRSVLDESSALLVPCTPEGLAEGIVALLRDPARGLPLVNHARALAAERFGWTAFRSSVRDIYNELRQRGSASRA